MATFNSDVYLSQTGGAIRSVGSAAVQEYFDNFSHTFTEDFAFADVVNLYRLPAKCVLMRGFMYLDANFSITGTTGTVNLDLGVAGNDNVYMDGFGPATVDWTPIVNGLTAGSPRIGLIPVEVDRDILLTYGGVTGNRVVDAGSTVHFGFRILRLDQVNV